MWTSLKEAVLATLLLSTFATAFPHVYFKHGNHFDRLKGGQVITIIVKPMPIGTKDGIAYPGISTTAPRPSTIASGKLPPKFPTRSGSLVFPTGNGTSIPVSTRSSFPTFTGPPVVIVPSGTEPIISSAVPTTPASSISTPSNSFPVFTGTPIISVPGVTVSNIPPGISSSSSGVSTVFPGTDGTSIASPVPPTGFPDFTGPPIISTSSTTELAAPTGFPDFTGPPIISASSTTEVAAPTGFPDFTGPPIISASSTTEVAAPTVPSTTTSEPTPTPSKVTFPPFTGAPIISVPPV